jgi:hypothetical protein
MEEKFCSDRFDMNWTHSTWRFWRRLLTLRGQRSKKMILDFHSEEGLEAILQRELIEIARFNGVSDPETLRDILLDRLPRATP